jgi:hypothetical protein
MVNRFLRDSIKQKLGEEFLINKKISEIPKELLESIKSNILFVDFLFNLKYF